MYYENNIKLLKKNYNQIYKDIIKIIPNKNFYEVIKTKTNQLTLQIIKENKSIYLHSKYNPTREAKNIAEENYDLNVQNYIIFGLGFGYHVEQLMKIAPNANFYILETNKEIFRLAVDNVDLTSIIDNNRIHLYVSDDIPQISKIFNNILLLDDMKIVLHNTFLKIIPNHLLEIKHLLEEFKMKEKSVEKFTPLLEQNFKVNIENYDKNVDILFNKFKNIPLYIISAGPSLDKNIKELKKVKGIILSVGRAVRPLLKEGIAPNLIIITDPQQFVYDRQLKDLHIDVPIIVLSTCDKNIMLKYKGQKLIALQEGYLMAEKYARENKNKLIQTGGSVATTALDVAINMGCNPIIFVGQDLAYTNNKTHSKATNFEDITVNDKLREVEDVYGNKVYTPKNLHSYLRWIQNRIKVEKDIKFIDATEGGARIMGTEVLTLRETIEKYSKRVLHNKIELKNLYSCR